MLILYAIALHVQLRYIQHTMTTNTNCDRSVSINNNNSNTTTKNITATVMVIRSLPIAIIYVSITYQLFVLCISCCAAAWLRRHLMVWAVFAPKVSVVLVIASIIESFYCRSDNDYDNYKLTTYIYFVGRI